MLYFNASPIQRANRNSPEGVITYNRPSTFHNIEHDCVSSVNQYKTSDSGNSDTFLTNDASFNYRQLGNRFSDIPADGRQHNIFDDFNGSEIYSHSNANNQTSRDSNADITVLNKNPEILSENYLSTRPSVKRSLNKNLQNQTIGFQMDQLTVNIDNSNISTKNNSQINQEDFKKPQIFNNQVCIFSSKSYCQISILLTVGSFLNLAMIKLQLLIIKGTLNGRYNY